MKPILCIISVLLFAVLGIMDCIADEKKEKRPFKPFLIPLLVLFYVTSARQVHVMILIALLFCWFGDIFMLRHNPASFRMGLASFLLGHLCYSVRFLQEILTAPLFVPGLLSLLGFGCWLYAVQRYLKGHTPEGMVMPSLVYMGVLALSGFLSVMRFNAVNFSSWIAVVTGMILFCISDTLIAIREWRGFSGRGVMETYLLAQFLIVAGYILLQ